MHPRTPGFLARYKAQGPGGNSEGRTSCRILLLVLWEGRYRGYGIGRSCQCQREGVTNRFDLSLQVYGDSSWSFYFDIELTGRDIPLRLRTYCYVVALLNAVFCLGNYSK